MDMLCIESALKAMTVIAMTRATGTTTFAGTTFPRKTKRRETASSKLKTMSTERITASPRECDVIATTKTSTNVDTSVNIKILRVKRMKSGSLSSGDAKKFVITFNISNAPASYWVAFLGSVWNWITTSEPGKTCPNSSTAVCKTLRKLIDALTLLEISAVTRSISARRCVDRKSVADSNARDKRSVTALAISTSSGSHSCEVGT